MSEGSAGTERGRARRELPSGTVTFLFTDIEGSTRLLERLGPAYEGVRWRRCLRPTSFRRRSWRP